MHSSFHLNSPRSDSGLPEEFGDRQTGSPHVPPVSGTELCPVPGRQDLPLLPQSTLERAFYEQHIVIHKKSWFGVIHPNHQSCLCRDPVGAEHRVPMRTDIQEKL